MVSNDEVYRWMDDIVDVYTEDNREKKKKEQ